MQYRKRPLVVEAQRFKTNNEAGSPHMDGLVEWANDIVSAPNCRAWHDGTDVYIETLEGVMRAEVGDWIICGVKGELYPCKPDVFAESYEAVPSVADENF